MDKSLPGMIVTGASGFIGRHFVIAVTGRFRLFCIARRSQKEAGIPKNENLQWIQADISRWKDLMKVIEAVKANGGADYVLHMAGYYDFTMDENPAYEKTNVTGTRYILNMSQLIGIKHFIFTGSLAACKFPPYDILLTEESPADAEFPYARSKRKAEKIIRDYSDCFPCSVIRLAAVYSDWCEYPPLYILLKAWLSKTNVFSRFVGGRGESAVPYIHVQDVINVFLRIFDISETLPKFAIYIASPPGSVAHKDLFETATRYYFGQDVVPIPVPRFIAGPGLIMRSFVCRLMGKEPFEQPWMVKYIDLKLNVDPSATYSTLGWKPTPRRHILRRLLFLTEKMINHPVNWTFRNEALMKRVATRQSTTIYDVLEGISGNVIKSIINTIMDPDNEQQFINYREMDRDLLKWYVTLIYQLIAATVRSRDRTLIHSYARIISSRRYVEGFKHEELQSFLLCVGQNISERLMSMPALKDMEHRVYDYIHLTIQYTIDEIEDSYEILASHPPERIPEILNTASLADSDDLKRVVREVEDICGDSMESRLSSDMFN